MVAPGAFVGHVDVFVHESSSIRTGLDAVTAGDTVFVVNEHKALFVSVGSTYGAYLNARGMFAMIT